MTTNTKEQWKNNLSTLFIYKSDRKNAKIVKDINIRHLITSNENGACNESTIENYFINIVGSVVYTIQCECLEINVTSYTSINHMTTYHNVNHELVSHNHTIRIDAQRKHFSSIEQLINHIYDIFLLIYPYTRLDLNGLYNDPTIKQIIREYYK